MIQKPILMHKSDDDSAPIDYTFVSNVSEGRRRRQETNMKPDEEKGAVVRHRVDPFARTAVDEYGTRARMEPAGNVIAASIPRKLPSAADGPAPATSIAYPENYGIPDNPFEPPVQAPPVTERAARTAPAPRESAQRAPASAANPAQRAPANSVPPAYDAPP
ncbi:MAG: hypothetical protein RR824_10915, partial [Clostridia bacterium]